MTEQHNHSWNQLFSKTTESHWDSLFRFLVSLTHNEIEAEDLLQQTLLKGLKNFSDFFKANYQIADPHEATVLAQGETSQGISTHLHNWLMKIAKNTFLDSVQRSSKKFRHFSIDEWDESDPNSNASGSPVNETNGSDSGRSGGASAESQFYALALDDEWTERLSALNPKQRTILYLAAEDYSYKEIAHLLDIPIGTVMSTLSRTITKLKKSANL